MLPLILAMQCAITMAHSESVVVSLSNYRVTVTSNYSGERMVLFGSIEPGVTKQGGSKDLNNPNYDVVVTVTGPRSDAITRQKQRTLGIWINRESREFIQAPAYLGIFANRPIDSIASADFLRQLQVGLENIEMRERVGGKLEKVSAADTFRSAFVRLRIEQGLYSEVPDAVTFLTPTLFRAAIPIPAEVPVGTYDVDIKVFTKGALAAKNETVFEIVKVGFEQFVADAARRHGLWYGITTAVMALMVGWLGSVVFRRD